MGKEAATKEFKLQEWLHLRCVFFGSPNNMENKGTKFVKLSDKKKLELIRANIIRDVLLYSQGSNIQQCNVSKSNS